jgi:hypothetical protein
MSGFDLRQSNRNSASYARKLNFGRWLKGPTKACRKVLGFHPSNIRDLSEGRIWATQHLLLILIN